MITGAGDNCTTEAWTTRNLLCIFTVLTDKRHICRLCLSSRSSYGDPSYFDKLRYILCLAVNNKNLKFKKGKTRKKNKTLKSGEKRNFNAPFGYLENVDNNRNFHSHILIEKRKKNSNHTTLDSSSRFSLHPIWAISIYFVPFISSIFQ